MACDCKNLEGEVAERFELSVRTDKLSWQPHARGDKKKGVVMKDYEASEDFIQQGAGNV